MCSDSASHSLTINERKFHETTKGTVVKCWLNGRLIHNIKDAVYPTERVYATSALDKRTGEIIIKEVNASAEPMTVELTINGVKELSANATATVLSSNDAKDENSIENPQNVFPKVSKIAVAGNVIKQTLPGNSFTMLRVPNKNGASSTKLSER